MHAARGPRLKLAALAPQRLLREAEARWRPRLEREGAARNGEVCFTVRDRGPGIPAPDRARVRRPFARLESADRKETPGAGLGLSLAAATMEAHGGRLEIGSGGEAGGAAVTLVLPAQEAR